MESLDLTDDLPDLATVPSSSNSPVIPNYAHRKLPNNQSPPTCLVCLHPATGYHYDTEIVSDAEHAVSKNV
ncbi:unnamed protein product [Caenorhabditis brenneri]